VATRTAGGYNRFYAAHPDQSIPRQCCSIVNVC
jgi:hypothetical protein